MSRRTLGLGVALVLAAFATALIMSYVKSVEDRAFGGAETVRVYVARETIAAGTSGEEALRRAAIEQTTVPRRVVAEGAIANLEEIRGRVAAVTILKGEQIVSARFVAPGQARGTLAIPADRQAMSIEVDVPTGVASFIQPGDRVSVLGHFRLQPVSGRGETRGPEVATVRYLLQNVQVLAVGQHVVLPGNREDQGQAQAPASRVLLTLALTPQEAEKLGFALFEGDVYFTLLPPGQRPVRTPGRTANNVFQ